MQSRFLVDLHAEEEIISALMRAGRPAPIPDLGAYVLRKGVGFERQNAATMRLQARGAILISGNGEVILRR